MWRGFARYFSCVAAVACAATLAACTSSRTPNSATATTHSPVSDSAPERGSSPAASEAAGSSADTAAGVSSAGAVVSTPGSASSSASTQALAATAKPSPRTGPTASPTASVKPKPSATVAPAPPQPLLVEQLANVGNAQQVVIVTSTGWGTSHATLQTFEKDAGKWRAVFPATPALIGRSGFSANRTEGDGTTPTGRYGFGTMFGQQPNPGVAFPYRRPDAQSVWVGDSTSPFYNTWQENAALVGEHLASASYARPYAYAAVINFNATPVVPYKGSAIFLHVSTGSATAGCVSIAQSSLLPVLRWLDPAKAPVIVMGPSSVIRQY
jgi:L,D-peptidoglycan transpeptidase YkuD (ErfK/YbiS/YcfS/YnhG family)